MSYYVWFFFSSQVILFPCDIEKKKGSYFEGFANGEAWNQRRRTNEETRRLAHEVEIGAKEAKDTGVTGESPFFKYNEYIDAVFSFLPEPFHGLYEVFSPFSAPN